MVTENKYNLVIFSENELDFLIKDCEELIRENKGDVELEKIFKDMLDCVEKSKTEPDLKGLLEFFYGHIESAVSEKDIMEAYTKEEQEIIKSIWDKLKELEKIYGYPYSVPNEEELKQLESQLERELSKKK